MINLMDESFSLRVYTLRRLRCRTETNETGTKGGNGNLGGTGCSGQRVNFSILRLLNCIGSDSDRSIIRSGIEYFRRRNELELAITRSCTTCI